MSENDVITLESGTEVENVAFSGLDGPSPHASWKDLWEKTTREEFGKCAREGCGKPAKHGGHVFVNRYQDENWYFIIPLCDGYNPKGEKKFEVVEVKAVRRRVAPGVRDAT